MSYHIIDNEHNALDEAVQRQGHGTVAGGHIAPGSVGTGGASSLVLSDDPRIIYYDQTGLADEMSRKVDVASGVPTSIALTNSGDKVAWSYTPAQNVLLYQFAAAFQYNTALIAGNVVLNCAIYTDSSGPTVTQVGGTAYDELSRVQGLAIANVTSGSSKLGFGWTGFHFYLNQADISGQYYQVGMVQAPVSLTAGTKYWFVITASGPTAGTTLGTPIYWAGGTPTAAPSRAMTKANGGSWTNQTTFQPKYAIVTSGWKISHSINGSFGGVNRQLSNYDYTQLLPVPNLNAQVPGYGTGANGNHLNNTDLLPVAPLGPNDPGALNAITLDKLASHGPYFNLTAKTDYVGFVQDIIEEMNYDCPGLADCTQGIQISTSPSIYRIQRKELVLYIDNVPVTVLMGGNTGNPFTGAMIPITSTLRQLTDYVGGLDPVQHNIRVGLRYYSYLWDGTATGTGAGAFSEQNSVPDQVKFEGIELRPRISFDTLGIYSYSLILYCTSDASGNAIITTPPPAGYTLIQYVGAYNPTSSTTSVRCSIGANAVIIQGAPVSTANIPIRITMLISPSRNI